MVANDSKWTPFGIGPRACPAQAFSMDTLTNITARIVREYRIDFSKYLAVRRLISRKVDLSNAAF